MKSIKARTLFSVSENTKSLLTNENENHFRIIDSLRSLSFHWVFWFHVIYILKLFIPEDQMEEYFQATSVLTFFWRGPLAVDVFFVISGFLITMLMIFENQKKGRVDVPRFYMRRFLRLMPVYFVAMLIIYVGYLPQFVKVQPDNTSNIWANIFYINNFLPYSKQFMLWSWSLAVEEQFYLLFPFLFVLLLKVRKMVYPLLAALIVLSFGIRFFLFEPHTLNGSLEEHYLLDLSPNLFSSIYDKLYTRFGAILCGVVAAYIYVDYSEIITKWLAKLKEKAKMLEIILLLGLLSIPLITFNVDTAFGHYFIISHRTLFSIIMALLLLLYLVADKSNLFLKGLLESKIWYPFAQLSYSNYIWHPMALFVFYFIFWEPDEFLSTNEIIASIAISYFATMLLSYLSFIYIEKPCMSLRKYLK